MLPFVADWMGSWYGLASPIRLRFPSALGSPVAVFDVLPDMTLSAGRDRPADGSTSARLNTRGVWPTGAWDDGLLGRMYKVSGVRDARPTAAREDGISIVHEARSTAVW
jgi:hypothetical protein